MRRAIIFASAMLLMTMTATLNAEIYRYIDENGQKRWTDDLSQVPVAQRQSAQRVEEAAGDQPLPAAPAETDQPPTEPDTMMTEPEPLDAAEAPGRDQIEKEKADLDALYQQLLAERQRLEKMNAEPMDSVAREDMTEKIKDYNKRAEDYEAQLNRFNEKVNAYNQSIMSGKPSSAAE